MYAARVHVCKSYTKVDEIQRWNRQKKDRIVRYIKGAYRTDDSYSGINARGDLGKLTNSNGSVQEARYSRLFA